MKKLIGLSILGVAFGAQPLPAQPADGSPRDGRPGVRALVEYLDLTQEQQDRWKALREQHRSEMNALREEGRGLRQRLRESLEADEPDAVVGQAAKAAHAHRELVAGAREEFRAELESILTPEQKEKLEAFEAARATGWKGRGAHWRRGSWRGARSFGG